MAEVINGKKAIVELCKQMSFFRGYFDSCQCLHLSFPMMHTQTKEKKEKLSQSIVNYHTYHSSKLQ